MYFPSFDSCAAISANEKQSQKGSRLMQYLENRQGGAAGAARTHRSPCGASPRPVPGAGQGRLLDWIDSQARVTRIWLDQLIAEGDPHDMISLIHRQAAWLDMMRSRLVEN
ncbi:MAG: hypothetical protein CME85_04380 [Henriciella sp.]|jgi:hypothetical protein|nr:hypothetical protein [Henriciella sp.]MBF34324.1 hypothetical protein [Hyphomonadaceae bacterium]MBK74716.1 hypothetical protein [Henriciella sp.]|tara:strand:- start:1264 stop:1596 length:333 start_codon:yes stop_codon:yes gene_type:complete